MASDMVRVNWSQKRFVFWSPFGPLSLLLSLTARVDSGISSSSWFGDMYCTTRAAYRRQQEWRMVCLGLGSFHDCLVCVRRIPAYYDWGKAPSFLLSSFPILIMGWMFAECFMASTRRCRSVYLRCMHLSCSIVASRDTFLASSAR